MKKMYNFNSIKIINSAKSDKLSSFDFDFDCKVDKNMKCIKISIKNFSKLANKLKIEDQLKIKDIIPCYINTSTFEYKGSIVNTCSDFYKKNNKTINELSKEKYMTHIDSIYILFTKMEDWFIINDCLTSILDSKKIIEANECSICLDEFGEKNICITECGHKYHTSCLMTWLQKEETCPNCKNELITVENKKSFYEKHPILVIISIPVGIILSPIIALTFIIAVLLGLIVFIYRKMKSKLMCFFNQGTNENSQTSLTTSENSQVNLSLTTNENSQTSLTTNENLQVNLKLTDAKTKNLDIEAYINSQEEIANYV
jgi:hypothetical protein